jgi:hypothetical protein
MGRERYILFILPYLLTVLLVFNSTFLYEYAEPFVAFQLLLFGTVVLTLLIYYKKIPERYLGVARIVRNCFLFGTTIFPFMILVGMTSFFLVF